MQPRPARSFALSVVSAVLLVLLFACDQVKELTSDGDGPMSSAERIADEFQDTLSVASTSKVVFVGPVAPGTMVVEDIPGDTTGVTLTVPDGAGTTYLFLIDDEPSMKLGHPQRFVWMDFDGKNYGVVDANWNPRIAVNGGTPAPFVEKESFTAGGVSFTFVEGEGAPVVQDDSQKPAYTSPLDDPAPAGRGGRGVERAKIRRAFVLDGGGEGGKPDAEIMYTYTAKPIADWVESRDFTVKHVSQYAASPEPAFLPGNTTVRNQVIAGVEDYGKLFTNLGQPDDGCDEFFLYVSAHAAGRGNFCVYYADGSDVATVGYDEILNAVKNYFPTWVKVTLFYDACFSGRAISKNRPRITELCGRLCSFTCITAADSVKTTPLGGPSGDNSATEDFMEGATDDNDGDGNTGDIQDRFIEMRDELGNRGPMSIHCPENVSWCSLDGPAPNQSNCADAAGTYEVAVNDVQDPENHREQVGEPFESPIEVAVERHLAVTGMSPFVNVTGEIDAECTFHATGTGTVAGYPNVSVQMDGLYDDGNLVFAYKMGANGELPSGESIIFFCTGTKR